MYLFIMHIRISYLMSTENNCDLAAPTSTDVYTLRRLIGRECLGIKSTDVHMCMNICVCA